MKTPNTPTNSDNIVDIVDHLVAVVIRGCSPDPSIPTDIETIKREQANTVAALQTLLIEARIDEVESAQQAMFKDQDIYKYSKRRINKLKSKLEGKKP